MLSASATAFGGFVCPTGKILAQAPNGGPPGSACTYATPANSKAATAIFILDTASHLQEEKTATIVKLAVAK